MTIYVVNLEHRWEGMREEYYINEENAKARVKEVDDIYAEAKAKGMGGHWGRVTYEKGAFITTIETKD